MKPSEVAQGGGPVPEANRRQQQLDAITEKKAAAAAAAAATAAAGGRGFRFSLCPRRVPGAPRKAWLLLLPLQRLLLLPLLPTHPLVHPRLTLPRLRLLQGLLAPAYLQVHRRRPLLRS